MALTQAFYKDINTNNVLGIHIMMVDSLLVDLSFKEFEEMKKVAERNINIEDLYDKHDGNINNDKKMWNEDYLCKVQVQILDNFSRERLKHLKEVVRYLYPCPVEESKPSKSSANRNKDRNHQKKKGIIQGVFEWLSSHRQ